MSRPTSPRLAPLRSAAHTAHTGHGVLDRFLRDPAQAWRHLLGHLLAWATGPGLSITVAATGSALGFLAVLVAARGRYRAALHRHARLIAIRPPVIVDPAGAEAFWANLHGLLQPSRWQRALGGVPHVSFEYAFTSDGTRLHLWIPGPVPPGAVERVVEAAWPGAQTDSDYLPAAHRRDSTTPVAAGGELRLARPGGLPIKTDHPADPLRPLLATTHGLAPGETALVQILARPTTTSKASGSHHPQRLVSRLLDLLTPGIGTDAGRAPVDGLARLERSAHNRALLIKQRGPQFETRIRYLLTGSDPADHTARRRLRGRAHAIAAAFAGYDSGLNHYRRHRLRHAARAVTGRRFRRGDRLNVAELAAIAHLPTDATVPGLEKAGARTVAPAPAIPTPARGVKPLGRADAATRRPVGLAVADARYHVHLLGSTGSGKSTLMAHLILADAAAGRGAVVIDPKGDLITDLLDRLPAGAARGVVLLDAGTRDLATVPCLNPLRAEASIRDPGQAQTAVDHLTSVFARVYAAWWGPRTDDLFRAACLTLQTLPAAQVTLANLPRLLIEPTYRHRATARITDPVLAGFWTWFDQLSPGAQAQAVAPLMNKLRAFLLRPFVRAALAAGPATLDFGRVLDGGLCLVRVPKGALGEETTKLIGSLVVAATWQAATARTALPENDRRDAALYVDECHNFLNLPYELADMLAEARGFRLSLVLAHQHLAQLTRDLREGISANARNKIYFTASPDDARDLARHTTPRLTEHDLAHLTGHHAAARLVVNGADTPPFTFTTQPLPAPVDGRAAAIRATAAKRAA